MAKKFSCDPCKRRFFTQKALDDHNGSDSHKLKIVDSLLDLTTGDERKPEGGGSIRG